VSVGVGVCVGVSVGGLVAEGVGVGVSVGKLVSVLLHTRSRAHPGYSLHLRFALYTKGSVR